MNNPFSTLALRGARDTLESTIQESAFAKNFVTMDFGDLRKKYSNLAELTTELRRVPKTWNALIENLTIETKLITVAHQSRMRVLTKA